MESVWNSEVDFRKREALSKDIECDILIIGAGMAGLLTAYMLTKSGREVVVIDAKSTASGVTKNTTAKITCQHDLIYDNIIKDFGEEGARQYAKANGLAIQRYKEIIDEETIDCDFERKDAYVYSLDNTQSLEDEYNTVKKLGIDAELVDEVNLPFKVKGALPGRFDMSASMKNAANDLIITAKNFIAQRIDIPEESLESIENG